MRLKITPLNLLPYPSGVSELIFELCNVKQCISITQPKINGPSVNKAL